MVFSLLKPSYLISNFFYKLIAVEEIGSWTKLLTKDNLALFTYCKVASIDMCLLEPRFYRLLMMAKFDVVKPRGLLTTMSF